MAVSSTETKGSSAQRRIGLSEWFALRRYPLPDFFRTLDELPASLSSLAERDLPSGRHFSGVLFVPGEYRSRWMLGWEYVPDRAVVFLDDGALYVRAATPDAAAESTLLDVHSLLYVRSSLLLLYGLLEVKADCGGRPGEPPAGEVRLEYNTVIWNALREPLARFIASACTPFVPGGDAEVRSANRAILDTLPFKFANGLRYYALEPGEWLRAAVFQPATWERRAFLPLQVTPNTLFAVTDSKVVLIEEKRSVIWRRQPTQGEYGWIFTYIPRDRVVDMVVTQRERWAELRMDLEWGGAKDTRSFLLEPAIAGQWQRSWREAQPH